MKRLWIVLLVAGWFVLALTVHALVASNQEKNKEAKVPTAVYELRIYHTHPGKLPALHARFKNHTNRLLEKHGMKLIGFWTPADPKTAENTLYYLVKHASQEAAEKNWNEFREDADWKKAKAESEKDGPLVMKVERTFLNPTEYSALK